MDEKKSQEVDNSTAPVEVDRPEQSGRPVLVGKEWSDLSEHQRPSRWNRCKAIIWWVLGILAGSVLSTFFGYLLSSL